MLRLISTLLSIAVLLFASLAVSSNASAVSAGDWQAGRIIDDSIFYTGNEISESDIQSFLNSKVPSCDTNGTKASSHSGYATRADWGRANGYAPPYTCLKSFNENISGRDADAYCGAINGGTKYAATIIRDVSQACGISARALIVLLEKEQGLVTDEWPWSIQYRSATGYGCPDTAPCDSQYYGFFNQVYNAAHQFKYYAANPTLFRYKPYQNNTIQYNPSTSCGSSSVFITTRATAGLYNYTPYQPNAPALANLYGSGDSCSAYGNRNFWRIFSDWFGSTTDNYGQDVLSFIRLNHSSGNTEEVDLPSFANYSYSSSIFLSGYPAVAPDGAVKPLFSPNGDLVFIRLNHSSGNAELVSYSQSSNYKNITDYSITGYPATTPDGAVVPLFKPNGDLSFIRLNHSSGNVEVVSYSQSSNYKKLSGYSITGYPAVTPDGAVKPLFSPNGDLVFIRLNHSSGNAELVSYSQSSNYKNITDYSITGYPATTPDGAVVPLFKPNGDLSFIRLNHSSGNVEVVSYSQSSNYKKLSRYSISGYPAVAPDGAVVPLFKNH